MHCTNFQNIIYALIIRSKDGMPLTATTDFTDEINKNVKECKRYVKLLSKKVILFPERCVLNLSSYSIYLISYLDVSYLTLCASSYPSVLAFSFLNELMKDFISQYDRSRISNAVRPYSFLEFDKNIHKTCQRYNKPQSLITKINLSELSLEIKLRPPYNIKIEEIESQNKLNGSVKLPYSISHKLQFQDLNYLTFMIMSLSIMLCLVSLFRGISTLCDHEYEEIPDHIIMHGLLFLIDSLFRFIQIILLMRQMKYRKSMSWISLVLLLSICWFTSSLRADWQNYLFIVPVILMQLCILLRPLESKLPEYQV